ncbi:polyprenyl synthetase family protein [Alicyclobacillus sp. ALC3]|uniref:polyprenyl synthetase family protein n=1 Tax=Alicyclobacillus sp. ALC3 TaxID=2796143 RepID=UPI00237982BD|nr:polyprenyl synthetase family protein [Alicyclobacillus sp. ALC3]WDL97138.1 polyprenyl synthetase family protein [Alicyclobacillus sp. ALC3]
MDIQAVLDRYHSDMQAVEALLSEQVKADNLELTQANAELLNAGGKRIRPLFVLMCSRFGDMDADWVVPLAAAVEMIHMATLVHDDVIDDAQTRRGRPTVRAKWGNLAAMYAGDYLLGRALGLLTQIPNLQIHREMSDAIVRMCEGEIEQIEDFYNWRQSLRRYLRRVERKTALLISVSCSLGAVAAGAAPESVRVLRRFGYYTGMAFQITDDVLDYVADADVVGKPVGGDLRQGNLTLPALHAARESAVGEVLRATVQPSMHGSDIDRALELVRRSDGLPFARDLARRYMEKAMVLLEQLESGQLRTDLASVAQFVNARMS